MERSYLATMSLLILHQIDAAYWKEWEMFYLPGGIQGFLFFNLLILPILLIGYKSIIISGENSVRYSMLCAGLGCLTFIIHAGFMFAGSPEFHLPASLLIIFLCLISSLLQIKQTIKYRGQLSQA
ncbi:DUF6713 family protein [Vibrio lamellibrachiae]|uniref:DUF6713 family protein n=1 Tax=Vibrio lamellibrachiae TaxID=2910253 RepID=UPI003D0AD9F5